LERALIKKEDGSLDFSRDIKVNLSMSTRDHYIDFVTIIPEVKTYLSAPALVIHATPASYGQESLDATISLLNDINQTSKTKIELQTYDGTHHFHMIEPDKTAERIHKFLDSLKVVPSTKL
jgi:alpha/beta superfamily hydrolase